MKRLNKKKPKEKFVKKCIPYIFFLSIALIYFHNLTRDIYSGDIGDLVTAANVFGVPHPPGYPLFTLLGSIFAHIPLMLPAVTKVALVSFFASFFSLLFFYKFSLRISKSLFLSLLSVSILAFSYLFWLHAEIPEVFGLHNLFVSMILFFSIRFYQERKPKDLYLLALVTGLSLTHHQTILFLFPSIAFLLLKHIKFIFSNKKVLLSTFLFGFLGLLPYIYVFIAASREPLINWDNATNIHNFIRLILRLDYGGFAPKVSNGIPLIIKGIVVKDYFKTLVTVFSYQILFVGFLGIVQLFKKDKLLLTGLLLAFLFTGPFFVFYATTFITSTTGFGIIERFYTTSTVVFMFFVPFGFVLLKNFLDKRLSKKIFSFILLSYFLIVPFFLIKENFPKTDLSKTQIGNNLANDILNQLPRNSVLFVSGDTKTFNIWYNHYVLKKRIDVGLVNPPGVGGNSYLEKKINSFYAKSPKTKLSLVFNNTLEDIRRKQRVFATYKIDSLREDTILIPKGLIYEFVYKKDIPNFNTYIDDVEKNIRDYHRPRLETLDLSERNLITEEIPLIYSNALVQIGDFVDSHYKNPAKAEHYYRRALWMNDQNPAAYAGLALSQFKAYNDCHDSLENMRTAISYYNIWKIYYSQLYILSQRCQLSEKVLSQQEKEYKKIFNADITKNR